MSTHGKQNKTRRQYNLMFTYQIIIEYLGTSFVGWQFQKNGLSIQEVLEKALSKFLKHKVKKRFYEIGSYSGIKEIKNYLKKK